MEIVKYLKESLKPYQKPNQFLGTWNVIGVGKSIMIYRSGIKCFVGLVEEKRKVVLINPKENSVIFPFKTPLKVSDFLNAVVTAVAKNS